MTAFYNEHEPYAAEWLRNLIAAGHIAPGVVDERSIEDILPSELAGFTQCHFFAGIGVWSRALRLAGWPDDRPVWTGSCPCQPFSAAGKGIGFSDERHLWPAWHHLIRERDPDVVFGEQVASKNGLAWFGLVRADMEAEGYAFGGGDICAACVGAPHIRQRLYFVADLHDTRLEGRQPVRQRADECAARPGSVAGVVADAELHDGTGRVAESHGRPAVEPDRHGSARGFWSDAEWIACRDGKARPVEPGTFPLAHGAPARVGRLRAYGNAIVAPLAAEFIGAYLDVRGDA